MRALRGHGAYRREGPLLGGWAYRAQRTTATLRGARAAYPSSVKDEAMVETAPL